MAGIRHFVLCLFVTCEVQYQRCPRWPNREQRDDEPCVFVVSYPTRERFTSKVSESDRVRTEADTTVALWGELRLGRRWSAGEAQRMLAPPSLVLALADRAPFLSLPLSPGTGLASLPLVVSRLGRSDRTGHVGLGAVLTSYSTPAHGADLGISSSWSSSVPFSFAPFVSSSARRVPVPINMARRSSTDSKYDLTGEQISEVQSASSSQISDEQRTLWQNVKKYRKVTYITLGLTSAILLYGYDNVVVGTISAMPVFQYEIPPPVNLRDKQWLLHLRHADDAAERTSAFSTKANGSCHRHGSHSGMSPHP